MQVIKNVTGVVQRDHVSLSRLLDTILWHEQAKHILKETWNPPSAP